MPNAMGKVRFLVNASGRRTGVLLTMEECRRALGQLEELEAFRLQGVVWVHTTDDSVPMQLASEPHPAHRIIAEALGGNARRYLADEEGKRVAVILSKRDYETACDALDDLEDIKAIQDFEAARLRGDPDTESISFEEAFPEYARHKG